MTIFKFLLKAIFSKTAIFEFSSKIIFITFIILIIFEKLAFLVFAIFNKMHWTDILDLAKIPLNGLLGFCDFYKNVVGRSF